MKHLSHKQLRNLTISQLDEIRLEVGHIISALRISYKETDSEADYKRMRPHERYLDAVKAVLQHKRNTGQK